jgi:hypothetical protein
LILLLLRSSSLWAVALSALPVWRRVDPLAVLAISPEQRRKLERELREAEQVEDADSAELVRMLDETKPAEKPPTDGLEAEADEVGPAPDADTAKPPSDRA